MNALDTNLLLRFVLGDQPEQAKKVRRLLHEAKSRDEPLLVTTPVLQEMIWALTKLYGFSRGEVVQAVEAIAGLAEIILDAPDLWNHWLAAARAHPTAGMIDLLIALSGQRAGAARTLTFDRLAARHPSFIEVT